MELTIEQALQQGVTAHKEGKLQEAQRIYSTILRSQPAHPDANHNLGVIAVAVNEVELALPLFKAALEANPKIEQFWLSYIDALIKEKQFDNAKDFLEEGGKIGLVGDKVDALKAQLKQMTSSVLPRSPEKKKSLTLKEKHNKIPESKQQKKQVKSKNANGLSPSQSQVDNLLEHFQNERYDEAEKLAMSITQQFPKHQFGWKVLGAVLGQIGRKSEAVNANQRAVTLAPKDSEAQGNLGAILQDLGRLDEAEASLRQAIALKPDFTHAYYNLGITLMELGRIEESETSYRQAIALKSDYAEAHNNLGGALQELGRLDEAEVSYRQTIGLKPDYAEAHNNLGGVLQELGRLEEAEASYRQTIGLKPDYAEAHSNLGKTLQELGRLEEAEASFTQAIGLKSDSAEAHNNFGVTLQKLGRLDEAEASYTQAILLKQDYAEAMFNLSIVLDYMNNLDESFLLLKKLLKIDIDNLGLLASVNLAIYRFLEGNNVGSKELLLKCQKIQEKTAFIFTNQKIYHEFLLSILSWHANKPSTYFEHMPNNKLYVIGESHSLTSHGLRVQSAGIDVLCQSFLIQGCKQSDLGSNTKNQYKNKFEGIFCSLPKSSEILLAIGEIDCRLDSGIIKHRNKYPEKNMTKLIKTTVENYIDYIFKLNSGTGHNITIQGVPCPNIDTKNIPTEKVLELIDVIREFNQVLKNKSNKVGYAFLDVHKLTDNGDGFSNSTWNLDCFHLSPEGMHEAWRRHANY
jgi:tetratricopeptide (TPR) repeat protein